MNNFLNHVLVLINKIAICASVVFMLFLIACHSDPDSDSSHSQHDEISASELNVSVEIATPGRIPAAAQRAGDPAKGKFALLNAPIVSCGIPRRVFEQLPSSLPVLAERTGPAANLPFDSNLLSDENGVEVVASNCLTCHGAPLFGEVVIGLGNEFRDFTSNPSVAVERLGALISGPNEIKTWEKFANRIATIAPYMQMETAGTNPANNLTFALMAHRDPKTLAWSDTPLLEPPSTTPPPVSVPPWWRMKKKNAMFWMGEGRGDHASIMMTAAILCTDSVEEMRRLDAIAGDVRAYIESLTPPAYPFEINQALAKQGETLFVANCSHCHGTYAATDTGEDAIGVDTSAVTRGNNHKSDGGVSGSEAGDAGVSYPNRLVALDIVGTDPTLSEQALGPNFVFAKWFNSSVFAESATAVPARGYVAPPLDGIWSTAPFLHNGSVPTIRAVLDSSSRPSVWRHATTSSASRDSYDTDNLGWRFLESETMVSDQWRYDTNKPGHSNQGHLFGDALTEEQRDAVLEYLKTL